MSNGKSPGANGLTVEFYVKFWVHIVDDLHKSIIHGLKKGKLSESQRRSVIRLIAKKGKDQADIKGWWPISLIDTDTKILAKCLANKLKKVCKEVIGPEQLAYVNGRVLQDGHLLVGGVLELARKGRIRGLIATVDFKGALDNIGHQAVWDSLHHMNCGDGLIAQFKTLYNGANSTLLNYGTQTNWFQLLKSDRQGDPAAAFIFILLLEIFLTRLKRHLKGLTLDIGTLLAVGYADNLTIFVESDTELQKAHCIIENLETGLGLAVKREKSEILELGINSTTMGIPIKHTIKIMGMHFCLNQAAMSQKNWDGVVNIIKYLTGSGKQRSLTEVGRANIIKAQLLPIISFVGSTLNLPPSYEKQISTVINQFLWAGGTEKEQRALCIKTRGKGGLSIPHIQSRHSASKCIWIQRLQEENQGVFSLAFQNDDIKIDWKNKASFKTPYPKIQKTGFVNECINDWSDQLHLLAPDWGGLLWPRLDPLKRLMSIARKNCPDLTIEDAKHHDWEGLNFLDKAALTKKAAKV
jgi:hypothetical protein